MTDTPTNDVRIRCGHCRGRGHVFLSPHMRAVYDLLDSSSIALTVNDIRTALNSEVRATAIHQRLRTMLARGLLTRVRVTPTETDHSRWAWTLIAAE